MYLYKLDVGTTKGCVIFNYFASNYMYFNRVKSMPRIFPSAHAQVVNQHEAIVQKLISFFETFPTLGVGTTTNQQLLQCIVHLRNETSYLNGNYCVILTSSEFDARSFYVCIICIPEVPVLFR